MVFLRSRVSKLRIKSKTNFEIEFCWLEMCQEEEDARRHKIGEYN